jgi:hypothetical protein
MSSNYLSEVLLGQNSSKVRRKCFISYYAGDTDAVETFLSDFGDIFIAKAIGVSSGDDFIDSNDSNYVMSKIRANHLGDSTVTICLIGDCTHSRRYVDWELKTSLRQGSYTPNGLLGILLPYKGTSGNLPPRFAENWEKSEKECFAMYRAYPQSKEVLRGWIEQAFAHRSSRAKSIKNSQEMMKYNRKCKVHEETH